MRNENVGLVASSCRNNNFKIATSDREKVWSTTDLPLFAVLESVCCDISHKLLCSHSHHFDPGNKSKARKAAECSECVVCSFVSASQGHRA